MRLIIDLDEGRYLELGCLSCKQDIRATLSIAIPFQMYIAALDCDECGEQLLEFDILYYNGVNQC